LDIDPAEDDQPARLRENFVPDESAFLALAQDYVEVFVKAKKDTTKHPRARDLDFNTLLQQPNESRGIILHIVTF
jgi:hypothetical protein